MPELTSIKCKAGTRIYKVNCRELTTENSLLLRPSISPQEADWALLIGVRRKEASIRQMQRDGSLPHPDHQTHRYWPAINKASPHLELLHRQR